MAGYPRWARLGWHGIALDVPAEWCPGRLEGDHANGYLRLEDETAIRLELRWEATGRRLPRVSTLVNRYLKELRRKQRRRAPEPAVVRGLEVRKLPLDHEVFTWRGEFGAHSLVAVCSETRRVVHVRVFFPPDNDLRGLARRIFASLGTAPQKGQVEWSAFGFGFRVGSAWRVQESGLRTGCLRFVFADGEDELEVARFSLAGVVLGKATLEGWFRETFRKALRRFRFEARVEEFRGSRAVRCQGVMRLSARPLGLLRRRRHLTALAWFSEEDDKIVVVRMVTRTPSDPRAEAIARTLTSAPAEESWRPETEPPLTWGEPRSSPGRRPARRRVFRRERPLSREQSLSSVPLRNEAIDVERTDEGCVRLVVPRREAWWVRGLSRAFYVPKRRKVTLDEIGSYVWELCDGQHSTRQIMRALSERHQLHRKEAEVSVVSYLRTLAKRRFLGIAVMRRGEQRAAATAAQGGPSVTSKTKADPKAGSAVPPPQVSPENAAYE